MAIEQLRQLVSRLNVSTTALAAIAAVLEEKSGGRKLDPAFEAEAYRLIQTLGAPGVLDGVPETAIGPLLAEIRSTLFQSGNLASSSSAPGWTYTDAQILRNQGTESSAFPSMWKQNVVPRLDGLPERLEGPGSTFLDIGVGVAALSLAMIRIWPSLRVVGLDVWQPALAIARENLRAAGLQQQVELREQAVQDLTDHDVFDLAWLPTRFIGESVMLQALQRIHRALRSGGWLLLPCINPTAEPPVTAFVRLRTVMSGGSTIVPTDGERLLAEIGYTSIRTLPSPPNAYNVMIAGRRP
jgi:SAM-dependent methyltransferase